MLEASSIAIPLVVSAVVLALIAIIRIFFHKDKVLENHRIVRFDGLQGGGHGALSINQGDHSL